MDNLEIIVKFRFGDLDIGKSFSADRHGEIQKFVDFNVKEIAKLKEKHGKWPTREEWEANMIRKD